MTPEIIALAEQLGTAAVALRWQIATAESCTGGLVSGALTEIAGSSAWFDRAFITYSNEAKVQMLSVSPLTLHTHGAVSEQTVREMLAGALRFSEAHIAVAISGIAGPGGGTQDKPVGTVCLGWQRRGVEPHCETRHFEGDRAAVREQSVRCALDGLIQLVSAA
jgi:nicotinamide-nucleotide amidase